MSFLQRGSGDLTELKYLTVQKRSHTTMHKSDLSPTIFQCAICQETCYRADLGRHGSYRPLDTTIMQQIALRIQWKYIYIYICFCFCQGEPPPLLHHWKTDPQTEAQTAHKIHTQAMQTILETTPTIRQGNLINAVPYSLKHFLPSRLNFSSCCSCAGATS